MVSSLTKLSEEYLPDGDLPAILTMHLLSTVDDSVLTTCCLLLTTCCLLLAAYCSLPTAYCPLFHVSSFQFPLSSFFLAVSSFLCTAHCPMLTTDSSEGVPARQRHTAAWCPGVCARPPPWDRTHSYRNNARRRCRGPATRLNTGCLA